VNERLPQAPEHALALVPDRAIARASSVVRLEHSWFILALSSELSSVPIQRTLHGMPLVLFRDGEGKPGAFVDRCPHRNVPLSMGTVVEGQLQCSYHGWRFARDGACKFIPSLTGDHSAKARNATAFAAREIDGFIYVYSTPGEEPKHEPTQPRAIHDRGYTRVRQVVEAECTMHAALENGLDVPHTQFLHRGLFRTKSRGIEIEAVVKRSADRVEAEYIGEPRPTGLVARILSPSGGTVTHFDRFIMPSIAEVEYRIGSENHFLVSAAMTPVDDFFTRIFAVVSFKVRIVPGWLLAPFLKPLALKIFAQDAEMLKAQTENIRRFGGEKYAWTDIDVLGREIWRLLKNAEKKGTAETGDEPAREHESRVKLIV
jgi:phenylpropionate dioxygenase-like ring-hydroxylating dioxygenase large terminal subunit